MNPTQQPCQIEVLSPDLTEEMLEELAIMAMEADEDGEPMAARDAFEVAAVVQACILHREETPR